jgi:hypothetical protein
MDSTVLVALIGAAATIAAAVLTVTLTARASRATVERQGQWRPSTSTIAPIADEARVYLHITADSQRAAVDRLKSVLTDQGFTVMRVILHESGPDAQVIYWNPADAREADTLAHLVSSRSPRRADIRSHLQACGGSVQSI